MPRVLLTAFGPYQSWPENASWLSLIELTKNLPETPDVTTRLYPVDLSACREKLAADLSLGFDYAVHVGQAPGTSELRLENIAVNIFDDGSGRQKIDPHGPLAYEATLPIADWAQRLREAGTPTIVSDHAGTYLCNAIYYLSHHIARGQTQPTQSVFLHVPLANTQATDGPNLPSAVSAAAILRILNWITEDQD
jgi:pyroglutamyl-peptidase